MFVVFLKLDGDEICTATIAMIAFAERPSNWRARFLSNKRARHAFAVMRWNCFTKRPYFYGIIELLLNMFILTSVTSVSIGIN